VTQAFASLIRGLAESEENGVKEISAEQLGNRMEIVSKDKWAKTFGYPEIIMMKELNKRAPQLFKKTIVTVDIIHDSADEALGIMTGCFASPDGGIPELGLGDAEKLVVLNAWDRYLTLTRSASRMRRWANFLFGILLFLGLLTTFISVLYGKWTQGIYRTKEVTNGVFGPVSSETLDNLRKVLHTSSSLSRR
jgi:hypothetical protein